MKLRQEMRIIVTLIASFFVSVAAHAQLPSAANVVPSGFKVTEEVNMSGTIKIEAKKPNETYPKHFNDNGIKIEITWMKHPMPDMIVDMVVKSLEEPTHLSTIIFAKGGTIWIPSKPFFMEGIRRI